MHQLIKRPIKSLGYNFIEPHEWEGQNGHDEYYLRNIQNKSGINYRNLSAYEIEVLVRNNNTSDDWNKLLVSDAFLPELVKNCKFYGLVRIGKLEHITLEYHNICLPVGLYGSTIISCDFGDNVVINNVNYLAHYIIGNEVMISNVHELHTTSDAKFGNGVIKYGEDESKRIWLEVCNENGGRKILPFNGMLPGDAYLWSKYRDDIPLLNKFEDFTEKCFDRKRGYYGYIGDRTVIKNTSIIKDVWIGSDAYIKGANKLKNLTINSSREAYTQIGEGCEIVNGIIDNGCRIFYGVKAVRFVMASHSQLKYGARLINSYLGSNATISCCEVLNSLIYPAHEQHHNNSFLCAALVMGQSNMAAGATIGSNHNSRAADGEIVAARGFWPGLCVSLKHNSKFATYTLIAKGDYPAEINLPLPFTLISNDESKNRLVLMPAYWFMYNMYALARNSSKYIDRDKRIDKTQHIEYDFLAPDTVNDIFNALKILSKSVAIAADPELKGQTDESLIAVGKELLENNKVGKLEVLVHGFENTKRPTQILKSQEAFHVYKRLIVFYGMHQLIQWNEKNNFSSLDQLLQSLPQQPERLQYSNVGGQLLPKPSLDGLLNNIKSGQVNSWDEVHHFYTNNSNKYVEQKLHHAYASLLESLQIEAGDLTPNFFKTLLEQTLQTKEWMVNNIYNSRAKDYENEFKKMVYENEKEMEEVVGKLEENAFILQQKEELKVFTKTINNLIIDFDL